MAGVQDLVDSFAPHASVEWDFGGGVGSGTLHYKAGLTGADNEFEIMAVNTYGDNVTDQVNNMPEERQRIDEYLQTLFAQKGK